MLDLMTANVAAAKAAMLARVEVIAATPSRRRPASLRNWRRCAPTTS